MSDLRYTAVDVITLPPQALLTLGKPQNSAAQYSTRYPFSPTSRRTQEKTGGTATGSLPLPMEAKPPSYLISK